MIHWLYVLFKAAHCVLSYNSSQLAVFVGINNANITKATLDNATLFYVSNVSYHYQYQSSPTKNDIALVTLSRNATLSSTVALACLPTNASNATLVYNKYVVVAGWGSTTGSVPL